jgi:uncharacterized protein
MEYRQFGKLDWQASVLGFGCMRLPLTGEKSSSIDQAGATRMIRFAIDQGVNYFDTAYVYHDRMSEVALGQALQDGYRQKVHIATKLPVWLVKETADFDAMLNEQLKKLQTDHIDVYLLHSLNRDAWHKVLDLDLLSRAEAALADGRIGAIGFSFHDNLDAFKEIVSGYDQWDFCQIQYNYMDIENQAGTAGLQFAADHGLAVVVMEPLLGGKLAKSIPAVEPLWEAASQKRTPADWALQWLWNQPAVTTVLSGMSTMQQVEENVASAARAVRPAEMPASDLEVIARVREALTKLSPIPCTKCEYCLPCPNGVNIPRNFDVYNLGAMYADEPFARGEYRDWIKDPEKAAQCIQCQECESKCPQSIPISAWLPVVEEVLGLNRPYVMRL